MKEQVILCLQIIADKIMAEAIMVSKAYFSISESGELL